MATLTTFVIGLRHGADWDHLAAITDITGSEVRRRHSAFLALVYATGHGAVVVALGLLAVLAGARLPSWTDSAMERVVGLTLVVLAAALVLRRDGTAPRSRGAVLFGALATVRARLRRQEVLEVAHEHAHDHDGLHRHGDDAHDATDWTVRTQHRHAHTHRVTLVQYGSGGALAVGALHGIGAETGTQALVLVSASSAHGVGAALLIVAAFGAGVFAMTATTAVLAATGWSGLTERPALVRRLTLVAATVSAAVGIAFLAGRGDLLPPLLGARS